LVAAKKLKTELMDASVGFFADRRMFIAEALAGLKILLRDATMDKVLAKANTSDKARSKQVILEMEKGELETKLDIARLKLELALISNQGNKENINKTSMSVIVGRKRKTKQCMFIFLTYCICTNKLQQIISY
jgi:hypothetical protein